MEILKTITKEMNLNEKQVKNTIELLNEGNTVPFISRYRKEVTNNLDETQIRKIEELFKYYTNLEKYKETVLKSIEEQGKLTDSLKEKIINTSKMSELEDIYLPYKKRKKTNADKAIEAGLEPLVNKIFLEKIDLSIFEKFTVENYETVEKVREGVKFIIGQIFSHDTDIRKKLRIYYEKYGKILSNKKKKFKEEKTKYDMYDNFSQNIKDIQNYRVLAINRGESEGILNINLEVEKNYIENLFKEYLKGYEPNDKIIREGLEYGFKNMLNPSIEKEVRNSLTSKAEESAIELFSKNLGELLLTPPLKNKRILAIDPGFRTGCKVVALDESGKFLEYNTIFPVPPKNDFIGAEKTVLSMIKKHDLNLIVIGNGTASRETQQFIVDTIKKHNLKLRYLFANEAGASVYSASKVAKEEFPDFDVTVRGAISIGRRIQDPLAELVKIDPKAIGVGQYQHDVNQKLLKEKLENTVESVVNNVGVNLNTASPSLLKYISGISSTVAKNILKYREENGAYTQRKELLKVKGFGKKGFEQAAGFLRIFDGKNPLEITGIHPESYDVAKNLINEIGYEVKDILDSTKISKIRNKLDNIDIKEYSKKLNIGEYTLNDIIKELKKPGRDLRDDMPQPILQEDILKFEDLKEGMTLQGKITNITDFGAFVDLGIKESGLIHKSKLSTKFVKHPSDIVSINEIVNVEIIEIDKELKRIKLKKIEK
ncbi:RNA-binding transcriptional accessory protein [Tepiditoga spiralis]|uniref:RNA-binding transcriptional accessory protein n=1 Tax=Tepiditoga spiralis TaxID=2108365 RepID=A0A7G1GBT0_9BACT|nr:Tex family protein [Tepiditoga spiralis]BBE31329.1 RNA-binding transcriptional accessory protein [Tepiditoga spiralis]